MLNGTNSIKLLDNSSLRNTASASARKPQGHLNSRGKAKTTSEHTKSYMKNLQKEQNLQPPKNRYTHKQPQKSDSQTTSIILSNKSTENQQFTNNNSTKVTASDSPLKGQIKINTKNSYRVHKIKTLTKSRCGEKRKEDLQRRD